MRVNNRGIIGVFVAPEARSAGVRNAPGTRHASPAADPAPPARPKVMGQGRGSVSAHLTLQVVCWVNPVLMAGGLGDEPVSDNGRVLRRILIYARDERTLGCQSREQCPSDGQAWCSPVWRLIVHLSVGDADEVNRHGSAKPAPRSPPGRPRPSAAPASACGPAQRSASPRCPLPGPRA